MKEISQSVTHYKREYLDMHRQHGSVLKNVFKYLCPHTVIFTTAMDSEITSNATV